ncbi:hypothetical protein OF897_17360 [Chryseobacterium formosus]|uniref:DUF8202 domain-containing protein n=1 Tax=Chryseobacterium formosus TaxID=1537363 RepID=A0ABT3XVH1_9FLAO|nr:hypothetical protein [Chryseobacterium formosus]MCX8525686.1 hypothetical protein [Chryseobacterium formosus]
MKKIFYFIIVFMISLVNAQTSIFGGVSGLAYRKNNVRDTILPTDTLYNKLMNFHFIKDTSSGNFFKKLSTGLNQSSIFMVSNKFGGAEKKVYAKVGSTFINSNGIYDFNDTLKINSAQPGHKIMTFAKSDPKNKINPIIFINKKTDPTLLIPEILVFNTNLSTINKQKIETYLSIKYGITINDISEKNYISANNEVIWDSKKNKNYNFRITGIGRDDITGLYQKQSKNWEDNNFAASLGLVQVTNNQNLNTLNTDSFLLWGDNNQALSFKEADLLSAHPKRDMARIWKAQVKNSGAIHIKTNLYLNHSGLGQNDKIRLRIFANDSNYQTDNSFDILGERLNDSVYIFKDAILDSDQDGIDYFTFNLNDSQSEISVQITSTCEDLGNGVVKISLPENILPYQYILERTLTNQTVVNSTTGTSSTIVFNNLPADKYRLRIRKQGQTDIVRTFDLEGIINQNVDSHYLWEGVPIELDLNTATYQYKLISPVGNMTQVAPYKLNGTGNYQLKIKNKLGCEITKTLSVLNQSDYESLQNNSLFKSISVSPNPSHDGNLTVKVELKSAKPLTIKIFNSLGVLVKEGQYSSATIFSIPMSIPSVVGYYNIKILIPEEGKGVNFLIN